MIKLSEVSSKYGAPMGRPARHNCPDRQAEIEFQLERMPLVDGAYDSGGAYWGGPDNLYRATANAQGEDDEQDIDIEFYVRGNTRIAAENEVKCVYPSAKFASPEMDEFLEAYMVCALWSSTFEDPEQENMCVPMDDKYTINDIAEATFKQMKEDCEDFQKAEFQLLREAYKRPNYTKGSAGHDFWLTRNGHGAGFWDRGLGELGRKLTDAAKVYKGIDLYVGDDGKIYS